MRVRTNLACVSILPVLAMLGACAVTPASGHASESERVGSPSVPSLVTADEQQQIAADVQAFAGASYTTLLQQFGNDNIVYSPYSAQVALAMTAAGADGTTLQAMTSALKLSLPESRVNAAFHWLSSELASRGTHAEGLNGQPFQLKVTNSLWGDKSVKFSSDFTSALQANYGAGVQLADFIHNPDESRQSINDWVSQATNDKIQKLLGPGSIQSSTRLTIVDAVYFNAAWRTPFHKAQANAAFTIADGTTLTSPRMEIESFFKYASGDNYEAVEIPYSGSDVSMVVVVPQAGQLAAVESSLADGSLFQQIDGNLAVDGEVQLGLPKFKLTPATMSLKPMLSSLGMGEAFAGNANFSRMATNAALNIDDVAQKAFISVDENGTEAAAATAVVVGIEAVFVPPPPTHVVEIDRPFTFYIRDNATHTPLFVGHVVNPSKS